MGVRYEQYLAIEKAEFQGIVESALMRAAYIVLQDRENPDYEQRAGLSRLLFDAATPQTVKDGYVRLFSWWAVNDPTVQTQYMGGNKNPAAIQDEAIDNAVMAFWDTAANVQIGE